MILKSPLSKVSSTEDLTRVPHFSYDQFYVIYSRFLNLDADEDFMLGEFHSTQGHLFLEFTSKIELGDHLT